MPLLNEKKACFSYFLYASGHLFQLKYVPLHIMTDKKEIIFIVNPRSGTHDKSDIPRVIEQTIDKAKFDYRVQFTEYAGHAAEIARRCVASDVNIVVAVGGDGTVNEVARSLVHTETALGIVPCGSGNGLARHLCIPMDIRKAIAIINRCNIEALDYGVINSLPFFCTCGVGFDALVSEKFAQAGKRGPITYMQKAHDLLEDTGLFLLHTIGANHQKAGVDPWFDKYIFPNGMLPSPVSVTRAIEGTFVLEDWENFGADYDKTLMAWYERFEKGLAEGSFACEEEVRRMYRYYLLSCAAAFRTRDIQLWQLVLSPRGVPGGYRSVR